MGKWVELIAARQQRHLSQLEAAEKINVGTRTYQQWELGLKKPQPRNWREVLKAFPELDHSGLFRQSAIGQQTELDPAGVFPTSENQQDHQTASHHRQMLASSAEATSVPPSPDGTMPTNVSPVPENIVATTPVEEAAELSTTSAIWTLAVQSTVRHVLKEFATMDTTNKNDQITRRTTLEMLAQLPLASLGLSLSGSSIKPAYYGDALVYCAAASEACWGLFRSSNAGDVQQAFQSVSMYLPILKTVARDSTVYRREALDLAARYALLQTLLGWDCSSSTETISYANDAVTLSKLTGDILLQLSAYIKLAWAYFFDNKGTQALRTMQEGEDILKNYQKSPGFPPLPSSIIGGFHSTYALIKRPVKPLPFRHGDIRAYLSWGLGTGALKPIDM
jgi:transcriptional regulator with XRE-family HTH domain